MPPLKPTNWPPAPITRWQGITTHIGFLPIAAPTALHKHSGLPSTNDECASEEKKSSGDSDRYENTRHLYALGLPIFLAIAEYEVVSPKGISCRVFHTCCMVCERVHTLEQSISKIMIITGTGQKIIYLLEVSALWCKTKIKGLSLSLEILFHLCGCLQQNSPMLKQPSSIFFCFYMNNEENRTWQPTFCKSCTSSQEAFISKGHVLSWKSKCTTASSVATISTSPTGDFNKV